MDNNTSPKDKASVYNDTLRISGLEITQALEGHSHHMFTVHSKFGLHKIGYNPCCYNRTSQCYAIRWIERMIHMRVRPNTHTWAALGRKDRQAVFPREKERLRALVAACDAKPGYWTFCRPRTDKKSGSSGKVFPRYPSLPSSSFVSSSYFSGGSPCTFPGTMCRVCSQT